LSIISWICRKNIKKISIRVREMIRLLCWKMQILIDATDLWLKENYWITDKVVLFQKIYCLEK
jgi:hypothetical protein